MQTILNPSDEKLREMIAEKDREIARLEEINANNWAEYRSKANHPASIKEAIASIDSGPGWVTSITISRTEWFRLLTAIEGIEKDAERYRKLKKHFTRNRAANPIDGKWVVLECRLRSDFSIGIDGIGLDETVDALPEVQS